MQLTLNHILFALVSAGVAFLWLSYLKTVDVFRPDSWQKLLLSFFTGWLSVVPPLAGLYFGVRFFGRDTLGYFLFDVSLIEESGKLLVTMLVLRFLVRTNEPVDYLVHAAAVACGFAAIENMLYINEFGINVLRSRGMISVFMHMAFSALPVYYYTLGRSLGKNKTHYLLQSTAAFVLAIVMHGLYNFFLQNGLFILSFFLFFILIEVWLTQVNNLLNLSPWFDRRKSPDFKSIRARLLSGFVLLTFFEIYMEFENRRNTLGWLGYTLQITLLFAVPMLMIMSKFSNLRLIPGKLFPFGIQLLNTLKVAGFRPNRDDTAFTSPLYNLRIDTTAETNLSALLYSPVQVIEIRPGSGEGQRINGTLSEKYWLEEDEVYFGFVPQQYIYAEGYRSDLWLLKAKTQGEYLYQGCPEALVYFIPEGSEPVPGMPVSGLSARIRCYVKASV